MKQMMSLQVRGSLNSTSVEGGLCMSFDRLILIKTGLMGVSGGFGRSEMGI